VAFKDRDFILRVPDKKCYHYKMIETLALSAAQTNQQLKSYIVCPGLIYGYEQTVFYEYYKMAWLQKAEGLPIIGAGKNYIPTIHIQDLVNLVKRIVETKLNIQGYIFAVDRTKNKTLKHIIKAISKSVGDGKIEHLEPSLSDIIPSFNELSIDVRVKTSKVFDDERKEDEEEEEDFNNRLFKWHCEVKLILYSLVLNQKEKN
jgi:adenylate kinase